VQAITGAFLFASTPSTAVIVSSEPGFCSESGTQCPGTILPYFNIVITFYFEMQGLCSEFRTSSLDFYPKLL
jgi:hypothetical protein